MCVMFVTVNGMTLNLLEMFYCFNIKFCLAASGYVIFIYSTSFVVIKLCNCRNKMPTRCNRGFFIADLIACSTCFGHHYAHHQELKSIIQWLLPVVFRAVVFKLLVWLVWSWGLCVRFAGCCSILQTGHITLSSTPGQQLEYHSTKYHR